MSTYKIMVPFFVAVFMMTSAYGQQVISKPVMKTVSGVVTKTDFVGNTISIQTDDLHQMSFFVPGNVIITQNEQDIGLMDIKQNHPVIIQYDIASPGKNIVTSIVDNNSSTQE